MPIQKLVVLFMFLGGVVLLGAMVNPPSLEGSIKKEGGVGSIDSLSVWKVYKRLGKIPLHQLRTRIEGVSAQKGQALIFEGITDMPNGQKTKKQSKSYTCIACHNTVKEFDDLRDISANARLSYAIENDIPYLQGSSFYGIVNRTHFYNDEYHEKRIGALGTIKSKTDLREAIQMCATTYAQGRLLEDWELESVLAYFWTIDLKISDLKLSLEQKSKIKASLETKQSSARAVNYIKNAFKTNRPAHFTTPMEYVPMTKRDLNQKKQIEKGRYIYQLSCLHCHQKKRFSSYVLNKNRGTFNRLSKALQKENACSVYIVGRLGTTSKRRKLAQMPAYTLEKMSEEQMESLRVYIQAVAKGIVSP